MSILCKCCKNTRICEAANLDHPTATQKICSPREVKAYRFTNAEEGTLRAVYTQCTLDAIELNVQLVGIPEAKRSDIAARIDKICPAEKPVHGKVRQHWNYSRKQSLDAETLFSVEEKGKEDGRICFDKDGNDQLKKWSEFKRKVGYQPLSK